MKLGIGFVGLVIAGYVLAMVVGVVVSLSVINRRDTPQDKATGCRILKSAIYDIEQALEKEKITERGVRYRCDGNPFAVNLTNASVTFWSREQTSVKVAEQQDCRAIIATLPERNKTGDTSIFCNVQHAADGRIAVSMDIYFIKSSGNLPPERSVKEKPDPTEPSV